MFGHFGATFNLFIRVGKLCALWIIRFGSNFTRGWSKYVVNNAQRDLRIPVSVFATVARKSFNGKFTAKKIGF